MPDEQNFPEPGSLAADQNIHGRAGQNLSLEQLAQQGKDELAENAKNTPPPPGFDNYAQWAATVNAQLAEIKLQNEKIILMLESR